MLSSGGWGWEEPRPPGRHPTHWGHCTVYTLLSSRHAVQSAYSPMPSPPGTTRYPPLYHLLLGHCSIRPHANSPRTTWPTTNHHTTSSCRRYSSSHHHAACTGGGAADWEHPLLALLGTPHGHSVPCTTSLEALNLHQSKMSQRSGADLHFGNCSQHSFYPEQGKTGQVPPEPSAPSAAQRWIHLSAHST